MNSSLSNKIVSIGGKVVITDWRSVSIASPKKLQEQTRPQDVAKSEALKQSRILEPKNTKTFTH